MSKRSSVLALLILTVGASACLAQSNPSTLPLRIPDKGFSSYTNLSQSYDSSANWTSTIDSTISYSFNRVFGISVGAPFYLAYNQPLFSSSTTLQTLTTTQTAPISGYNAMGDMRFGLRFATPTPILKYVVTVTGTAPTGDTSLGLSTGRFTGDFNNHLEFDLGRISPLVELGLANTSALVTAVKRPYTTLGMLSHYKAGLGIPLGKVLNFEISGYENLPLGLQKLYSAEFDHGNGILNGSGQGKSIPIYEQAATIIGNGFTEDNGFSTGLNADLGRRIDMGFTYDRSARQKLDTVEFSIGFRIGRALAH
ncbi:MAG TPA: hypothetical protein VJR04_13295 [Terriglobales bacterium]|nr:hypothetical protein [Terriglobales bacterium]